MKSEVPVIKKNERISRVTIMEIIGIFLITILYFIALLLGVRCVFCIKLDDEDSRTIMMSFTDNDIC